METRNEAGATEQAAATAGPAARHALRNLRVSHISLVEAAANGRAFLAKAAADGKALIERTVMVLKSDPARRMVYGIVYAPGEADTDADTMSAAEIEKAAYGFMKSRAGAVDADHDFGDERGYVAESWLVRKGDELFAEEPAGAWAVGIKVEDDKTWERVEKGELKGLSLAGIGERHPLEAALEKATAAVENGNDAGTVETAETGLIARVVAAVKATLAPAEKAKRRMPATLHDDDSGTAEDPPLATMIEAAVRQVLTDQSFLKGVPEGVLKGSFKDKLLRAQLWQITNALADSVRECLEEDDVTDKVAGVRAVVDEFSDWLEAQVSGAVAKGEKVEEPAEVIAEGEDLAARIEALEKALKQTNGRQTMLGGTDAEVKKQRRGLSFVQA